MQILQQIPYERFAHNDNGFKPKGRVQYIKAFEVFLQSAINHLIAPLQPAKSRTRVLLTAVVKVYENVVIRNHVVQSSEHIPDKK